MFRRSIRRLLCFEYNNNNNNSNNNNNNSQSTTTSATPKAYSARTGRAYPPTQAAVLQDHATRHGFTSPFWLTRNQLEMFGLKIRNTERETGLAPVPVCFSSESSSTSSSPHVNNIETFNTEQTTEPMRALEIARANRKTAREIQAQKFSRGSGGSGGFKKNNNFNKFKKNNTFNKDGNNNNNNSQANSNNNNSKKDWQQKQNHIEEEVAPPSSTSLWD
eukprot:PhM_4_TR11629/c5_g1_i2/m.57247